MAVLHTDASSGGCHTLQLITIATPQSAAQLAICAALLEQSCMSGRSVGSIWSISLTREVSLESRVKGLAEL